MKSDETTSEGFRDEGIYPPGVEPIHIAGPWLA